MRIDWRNTAAVAVSAAGVLGALYLLCQFALPALMPFLLACLLGVITRPLVLLFSERTKCSKRVSAVLVTLAALVLLGLLIFLLCNRLLTEVQNLLAFLARDSADPDGEVARLIAFFRGFWARLPFLSHLENIGFLKDIIGDPEEYLLGQLQQALSGAANSLAGGVAALLRRLPGVLFFLLVTLIACFYVAVDYERVGEGVLCVLPRGVAQRVPEWRARAADTARRYLKAYLLLFLLTFAELTVGFLILGVGYPFLLAVLTALLDILPVLGVGTVLLPYALFSLAVGNMYRGVGLLILYAVITVVRQIAEPHLVGKSLGLHPLLLLISFYAGLRLFGATGLFLGPALALFLKGFLSKAREENA